MLKKFIIESVNPGIGNGTHHDFGRLAEQINECLDRIDRKIFWQESYILSDKIISLFIAEDISDLREFERESELNIDIIEPVKDRIDPTSAIQADLPYKPKEESSNFVI